MATILTKWKRSGELDRSAGGSLLEVAGLSKSFGGVQAVSDLCFEVRRGEIAALIGPNGAGKTTAFNLISGILPSDTGKMWFQGQPINGRAPYQVAAMGIARTFQNLQIFGSMTVGENVAVGRHLRSRTGLLGAALRLPGSGREEREIFERARQYLEWVGLASRVDHVAGSLPFGQQRSLEIARALATEPRLILLDEPGAGLNPSETDALAELIYRIRATGVTVLLVEHDMGLVMGIADSVIVLDYGRKIAAGKPEEIQSNEAVIAAYLGQPLIEHTPEAE